MEVHFSSATDLWATPQDFFDELNNEFNFDLDVCANDENAKCAKYYTAENDGLAQDWKGTCWMNPPYGREIGKWMRKAYESSRGGGNSGLLSSCPHRHAMVARLCHQWRDSIYQRPFEIWRSKKQRAFPFRYRNF